MRTIAEYNERLYQLLSEDEKRDLSYLCDHKSLVSEFIYLKSLPEYEILKNDMDVLNIIYKYNDFKRLSLAD